MVWVHGGCTAIYRRLMAYVAPRENKHGEITSYQVKWRLGGSRDGDPQNERFDDEDSAEVFKQAVDDAVSSGPPPVDQGEGSRHYAQ